MDPSKVVKDLQQLKTRIENTLKILANASRNNDAVLYKTKYKELVGLFESFEGILITYQQDVENGRIDGTAYESKIAEFLQYGQSIESRIPQRPQGAYKDHDEKAPLIDNDYSHQDLEDQSNLVIQAHKDDTEQIVEIVGRMKELNVAFNKVHALAEEQQIHIDNIVENIEVADEYVNEGNEQLDGAQKYQKKASKKLWTVLTFVGIAAIIVVIAIVIVCITKFA